MHPLLAKLLCSMGNGCQQCPELVPRGMLNSSQYIPCEQLIQTGTSELVTEWTTTAQLGCKWKEACSFLNRSNLKLTETTNGMNEGWRDTISV